MATCKICTSQYRAEIERMVIAEKLSYERVEQICKEKYGFDVSFMTIKRHCTKHIEGFNELMRESQPTVKEGIDLSSLPDNSSVTLEKVDSAEQAKEILKQDLPQLLVNHVKLTLAKQQQVANGIGSMSQGDIAAIAKLYELLESSK